MPNKPKLNKDGMVDVDGYEIINNEIFIHDCDNCELIKKINNECDHCLLGKIYKKIT
jgi:hypothetical protein